MVGPIEITFAPVWNGTKVMANMKTYERTVDDSFKCDKDGSSILYKTTVHLVNHVVHDVTDNIVNEIDSLIRELYKETTTSSECYYANNVLIGKLNELRFKIRKVSV